MKPTLHFQRFEFKYFLPKHRVPQLVAALRQHMIWDPFYDASKKGTYHVNSLYFDTPGYDCFWDKEAGVADRKKLRLRYYGDLENGDSPVYVEIKRKKDALILKDRVGVRASETAGPALQAKLARLRAGKANPNAEFTEELAWFLRRNSLRPKLFISYDRTALEAKRNREFRVSIDQNIQAREQFGLVPGKKSMAKIYPHGVVFEIKYQNILPAWFQRVLQKFELQRLAFSKYANAIRHVIPEFDDNNYLPV